MTYILLVFENTIKCFLLQPNLKLSELATLVESQGINYSFFILYALAIYLAPIFIGSVFIDSLAGLKSAVYSVLHSIRFYFTDKKNIYLIYGYNDDVFTLIKNEYKNKGQKKLFYVICDDRDFEKNISDEDKNIYYRMNARILSKSTITKEFVIRNTKFSIDFLLKKIDSFILFDSDNGCNLEMLKMLHKKIVDYGIKSKNIYCKCNDYYAKQLINDYIFSKKDELDKSNCNYEAFDFYEISAKCMFDEKNIEHNIANITQETKDIRNKNVKTIIIGLGDYGRAIFDETINDSVINQNGKIIVDIIDKDIVNAKSTILNKTDSKYVKKAKDEHDEECYEISNKDGACDGLLRIYFHEMKVETNDFRDCLTEIFERNDKQIDNIFLCTRENDESTVRAFSAIMNFVFSNNYITSICEYNDSKNANKKYRIDDMKTNIYVRIKSAEDDWIGSYNMCGLENYIVSMPDKSEIYNIKNIKNEKALKNAKNVNCIYELMGDVIHESLDAKSSISFSKLIDKEFVKELLLDESDDREVEKKPREKWRALDYSTKVSNIFLQSHTKVKVALLRKDEYRSKVFNQLEQFLNIKFNSQSDVKNYFVEHKDDELFEFAKLEHRRWCYNRAFNGFEYGEGNNKINKLFRKIHYCLVPYDKLLEVSPDTLTYDLMSLINIYNNKNKYFKS